MLKYVNDALRRLCPSIEARECEKLGKKWKKPSARASNEVIASLIFSLSTNLEQHTGIAQFEQSSGGSGPINHREVFDRPKNWWWWLWTFVKWRNSHDKLLVFGNVLSISSLSHFFCFVFGDISIFHRLIPPHKVYDRRAATPSKTILVWPLSCCVTTWLLNMWHNITTEERKSERER